MLIIILCVFPGYLSASSNYKPKIVEPITETWRWQNFPELSGKGCQCMVELGSKLYFGVLGGIIEYDGLNWNSFSISPNFLETPIVTLCVASDNTIYAGSAKGVFTFRQGRWSSIDLQLDFGDSTDFPYNKFPIIESSDKSIWIGACQGALRIKNNKITMYREEAIFTNLQDKNFRSNYKKINALSPFDVYSIHEDKSGKIWFGLRDGRIFKCAVPGDIDDVNIDWHRVDLENGYVKAKFPLINMDRSGRVYIISGEKDGGINIWDKISWKQFIIKQEFGIDDLQNDIILLEDGSICIGGIGRVFFIKDNKWKMFERTTLPFPSNRLRLFQTSKNNLWIIGLSNDVWRIDLSFNKWITYNDLSFQAEDKNGDKWFLTAEGKIVKNKASNNQWIQFDQNDGLIDAPVHIFITKNGEVWTVGSHNHVAASAYNNGTVWIKQTHPLMSWGIDRRAVLEAKDGSLWFGTCSDFDNVKGRFGGIVNYKRTSNSKAQRFEYEYYPSNEEFRLYGIYGMAQTSDENIWVGQLGFYMLNHSTKKWEKISKPFGLVQNFVDCIHSSTNGDLWVGTRTNGLFQLNMKTNKWSQFTTESGLSSNTILDVLCEPNGNIWIATDQDISHFDGTNWTNDVFPKVFRYLRDGISIKSSNDESLWVNQCPSLWYRRALYKENAQKKYYGDFKTTRYHPDKLPPQTAITFSLDRVTQPGNAILSWKASDPWKLTPTNQIQYSYRFDYDKWSPYSNKTSEIFLSIPNGKHTFEVRSRNRDMNIDPTPAVVSFYVEPPTWKEPWFILLILFFLSIIFAFIVYLYHRNKIINDLSEARARLFTNISHELRTPLTLIMGSLVKIIKFSEVNKEMRQPINLIQRNSQRLLRLVTQILDYRKFEEGQMKLETSKGDIVDFIKEEFLSLSMKQKLKKLI